MKKFMKKLLSLLTAAFLIVSVAMPAFAGESKQRVYDYAGLLNASEISELEDELEDASTKMNMDVVALSADDRGGKTSLEYAEDFYDASGLGTGKGKSGVVIFIDMEERSVFISTTGNAINYFNDDRIKSLTDESDELYSYLADGDYKNAFETVIVGLQVYYEMGVEYGQQTYNEETGEYTKYRTLSAFDIIIALLIPAVVAFLYVNNIKKQYRMEKDYEVSAASKLAYQATAGFAFAVAADELLSHNVTTRIIPVAAPTGQASGGSSSGSHTSTVHRGSSGTYHGGGGGGRHF